MEWDTILSHAVVLRITVDDIYEVFVCCQVSLKYKLSQRIWCQVPRIAETNSGVTKLYQSSEDSVGPAVAETV